MSYSEYKQFLKENGVSRTGAEGGEVALSKSDSIKALQMLKGTEVGVLGGDVYEMESDGYFCPTYDNWYCNKCTESDIEFALNSQKRALNYLVNYEEESEAKLMYVLVLDK